MNNMIRGDQYQGGNLEVGQRMHSILYGGRDGIITEITGRQTPGTIRQLGGGCIVTGGSAHIAIVFQDHFSNVPESILRGVQWYIGFEIENQETIREWTNKAREAQEAKKRAEEIKADNRRRRREELPAKYPYLKVDQNSNGAPNIRIELKRTFPGVKFSVRSDHNSIDVSWTNGPTTKEVKAITGKYEEGNFNGMEDIYEYDRENVWPDVFGGCKYIFEHRHIADEDYTTVIKGLCSFYGVEYQKEEWSIYLSPGADHQDQATHIANRILGELSIPVGKKVLSLERTDVTCGQIEEFYRVILG